MKNTTSKPLGRYADILYDRWFKRTFGEPRHERLMQLFLQALIPERKIKSITFGPQEQVNPNEAYKDVWLDVECTDEDGTRFLVEMQLKRQAGFFDRAVFLSSFGIQKQLLRGRKERDYTFAPVYFIGVLDFILHDAADPRVLYRYLFREEKTHAVMTDHIQFLFLELPKARNPFAETATELDKICFALRNLNTFEEQPAQLGGEFFTLLFNSAEIATFTPEEKIKYESDMTSKRDIENQNRYSHDTGVKEGIEIGREQGIQQGIERTVEALRQSGMPEEEIQRIIALAKQQDAPER